VLSKCGLIVRLLSLLLLALHMLFIGALSNTPLALNTRRIDDTSVALDK